MKSKSSEIIKAGLLVGTLDILAAFIYYFIKSGKSDVTIVLKYIASGLFGKDAYSKDYGIVAGIILHYLIAFTFTLFFFWLFPKIKAFSKNIILLTGIVYGVFVWLVMNLLVVPFSRITTRPFEAAGVIINMLILIACIGIPLSFWANKFYNKKIITF